MLDWKGHTKARKKVVIKPNRAPKSNKEGALNASGATQDQVPAFIFLLVSWKSCLHVVYPIPTPDAFPSEHSNHPAVGPWIMLLLSSAGGEGEGFYYHCLEVLAKHMLLASFLNPKDMKTSITWCLASSILLAQYYP